MKKLLTFLILMGASATMAFAEKIAVQIIPDQLIATCHDETEVGDAIKFKTVQDVYYKDKMFIAKNSPVIGIVDFANDNGWYIDHAQIDFKTFKTRDVNGNLVTINSPVKINGFETLKYKGNRKAQFFNYIGTIYRGKEIELIPGQDDIKFTVWLEK